jgi:YbgC/YbaW family acyl-CoA thioester hydrolase
MRSMFTTSITVEWGDCDEAGIVFYPNYFYWIDCTFQRFLRARGLSQRVLRERFDAVTPLVDVGAKFMRPCRYDDELNISAEVETWGARRFRLRYTFTMGEQIVVTGYEERAWARLDATGRLAGHDIDPAFKAALSDA